MAYWRLVILKVLPVLPVAVNLTSDRVIGMTPGGKPSNVSFVFLSGLKSIIVGGYFSLMTPSSSGTDRHSHSPRTLS